MPPEANTGFGHSGSNSSKEASKVSMIRPVEEEDSVDMLDLSFDENKADSTSVRSCKKSILTIPVNDKASM